MSQGAGSGLAVSIPPWINKMFIEDLDEFFDTDDFAEDAVLVLSAGPPAVTRTIPVIWEQTQGKVSVYDRSFYDEKFYSAIVETAKPFLTCKTSDAAGITRNMPIRLRGNTYYCFNAPIDDGFGVSLIFISEDKA